MSLIISTVSAKEHWPMQKPSWTRKFQNKIDINAPKRPFIFCPILTNSHADNKCEYIVQESADLKLKKKKQSIVRSREMFSKIKPISALIIHFTQFSPFRRLLAGMQRSLHSDP